MRTIFSLIFLSGFLFATRDGFAPGDLVLAGPRVFGKVTKLKIPARIHLSWVIVFWLYTGFSAQGQNYVKNAGFEVSTAGWTARNTVSLSTYSPGYTGTKCLRIFGRASTSAGANYSLLSAPVSRVYRASAWVRTGGATASTVTLGVEQVTASGSSTSTVGTISASNRWVQVSGLYTLQPTSTLNDLRLYITGPASGTDLYVDEVSFAFLDFPVLEGILSNPGFELGTNAWAAHGSAGITLAVGRTGSNALAALNRTAAWHGLEQSLLGKMEAGEPYFVSAWVKTTAPTQDVVKLSFRITDGSGTRYVNAVIGQASNAQWTWLHGYFTPQFTGNPTDLIVYLEGPPGGVGLVADDIYVGRTAGLRRAAASYPDFLLGGVVGNNNLQALNPRYEGAIAGNFHLASTENALKFSSVQPTSNRFTFANANLIADFGRAHGGTSRGHTFVWHSASAVPTWVTNGSPGPATLNSTISNHISTVGSYFADRVPWWDVVNEALNDSNPTGMRSTAWYDQPGIGFAGQGSAYIKEVMRMARAADPDCELFYNDYSIETVGNKSTYTYNMLSNMVHEGVPLDGVGMQAHLSLESGFNFSSFRDNLKRFSDLGLNIHVTEFDLRMPVDTNGVATPERLWSQGDFYFNFLGSCLAFPAVKVFQTWGFTDAYSWIPGFAPGYGAALPLDKNYNRKPAYWGIYNALAGQAEKSPVLASSGDPVSSVPDLALSGGSGRRFQANAINDFITLGVNVPFEGSYSVRLGVRRASNAVKIQLSFAPAGSGNYVNVGAVQDTYNASTSYASLDLGTNTFAAPGEYSFKFAVVGKNGSSSGYEMVLDYVRLTPVSCRPMIPALAGRVVRMNQAMEPLVFTAEDDVAMGTLQVQAFSSNTALVPQTNLTLTARAPFYALNIQPATDVSGSTEISIVANDGVLSATNKFRLDVYNPVPPVITRTEVQGGQVSLTVGNCQPGLLYRILASDSESDWVPVLETNSPPSAFSWTDPAPATNARFYRVVTSM